MSIELIILRLEQMDMYMNDSLSKRQLCKVWMNQALIEKTETASNRKCHPPMLCKFGAPKNFKPV